MKGHGGSPNAIFFQLWTDPGVAQPTQPVLPCLCLLQFHFTFCQCAADCMLSPMQRDAMFQPAGRAPVTRSMGGAPIQWLALLMVPTVLFARLAVAQLPSPGTQGKATPLEIVLVEAESVTPAAVAQWKKERFQAVAVALDRKSVV